MLPLLLLMMLCGLFVLLVKRLLFWHDNSPTFVSNPWIIIFPLCRPALHLTQVHIEYFTNRTMSKITVSSSSGVSKASIRENTKSVDAVSYLGGGR